MKKILTILLFVTIVPTMVFANFINLSVGTNYSNNQAYDDDFSLGSLKMGPEVRANFSFVEVGLKSQYFTEYEGEESQASLTGDVNFLIDLSLIQLGIGISSDPILLHFCDDGSVDPYINSGLEEWFMSSNLNWRLSAGMTLGHLRFIGDFTVPTNFQFDDEDTSTIIPDSFENGKVSISFLYSLF